MYARFFANLYERVIFGEF